MNFDPENPCQGLDIKNLSDVEKFFELESTHMPPYGYAHNIDTALQRSKARALIKQLGYIGKCHPAVPFLAINYYDNFISTHDIPTSLRQAIGVQKPQGVVNIEPETLKNIQDLIGDLSNDFKSNSGSGSSDHRQASHDNVPINDTSSPYPETPFDDDYEPFNDRSTLILPDISVFYEVEIDDESSSSRRPQFHDNELIDDTSSSLVYNPFFGDYEPIGESSSSRRPQFHDNELIDDTSSSLVYNPFFGDYEPIGESSSPLRPLFHDNEPIDDAPSSSSRTQLFHDDEPIDGALSLSPHRPLFHDIEPIDDVASSFSCTRPFRDDEPTDAAPSSFPQGSMFYDNEPIDHAESSSSASLPLCHDYEPTDAALSSSTCGSLFDDCEQIEAPTGINLDFLDWSSEDGSIQNTLVQGFEKLSIKAGTSISTPRPWFTESNGTISLLQV